MTNKTILLADDANFFIELEKTFFRREHFNLVTASNGVEALEMVSSSIPDLVFLDLFMPGMNGDECCRRIKADPKTSRIPVIIVTVSGKEDNLERCRQAGCDEIILKPINREHFISCAKKHLKVVERAQIRYVARLQIHFGKEASHLLADYAINLSTGGVFLETTNLMEENTPLTAEFVLPHSNAVINCKARVAWVNDPNHMKNQNLPVGMGIQFLGLSEESLDAIRNYIREERLEPMW
jgi:uncharacterized protein (TIGR02266 family)